MGVGSGNEAENRAAEAAKAKMSAALKADPELSLPVAAIMVLTGIVRESQATTMAELMIEVETVTKALLADGSHHSISLSAGCELFMRFVTRILVDTKTDFQQCRQSIIDGGQAILSRASSGRQQIAQLGAQFIHDGMARDDQVHFGRVDLTFSSFFQTKIENFDSFVLANGLGPLARGRSVQ